MPLRHNGRTIVRMSVNPEEVIRKVELGTSPLPNRIRALNRLCEAGYRPGLLIAPVILVENWQQAYRRLLERLADELSPAVKRQAAIEVILMTYSYVHRAINQEAFPNAAQLYDAALMTGRGAGKYCYRPEQRAQAEPFFTRRTRKMAWRNAPFIFCLIGLAAVCCRWNFFAAVYFRARQPRGRA